MAYVAPYIDEYGMHIPTYEEIRDDMLGKMQQIYGNDIYLEEDSMDYQLISIFAKKVFDTNCLAQLAYNNRTPITAIGVGLDNLAILANIFRKPATSSVVQLTLTGTPSTIIQNGEVSDGKYDWILPDVVVIPENGIITVEANCKTPGYISATPNTITEILTPVYGWISATNNYKAEPGTNIETDAELRGRFAESTRMPSQCVFDGIDASLKNIAGVSRVKGWENDTGSTSTGSSPPGIPAGLPPHSITFVVEGGDENLIANNILNKKTPGCYTNGTTEVQVQTVEGNINIIRFYRPTSISAYVKVSIVTLSGYTPEYIDKIKKQVVSYINAMQIGETLYKSVIWSISMSAMESVERPAFSVQNVQFSTNGSTWSANDLVPNFYNIFEINESMVTVEVT